MKKYSVFVLLLIFSCCDQPVSSSGPGQSVSLVVASADASEATLLLMNQSDDTLHFYGYGKSSPLKSVEELHDSGWTMVGWDWCATGAGPQFVHPKEIVSLPAPVFHRGVKTRMSFHYFTASSEESILLISEEYLVP